MSRYLDLKELPPKRQEGGTWVCRGCGAPLSGRRTSWCSDECRDATIIRYGINVRHQVWNRDDGVCARCGIGCGEDCPAR